VKNHQRFSNIAGGIQSIIVAAAVIVGGFWTAVTFGLVDWANQRRLAEYGLSMSIAAEQEPSMSGREYPIVARVRITNRAAKPRNVDFSGAPMRVQRVAISEGISTVLDHDLPLRQQPNVHADSRVIRSDETVEYPYLVSVPEKGIYLVSLNLKLSDEEYAVHLKSGGPPKPPGGEINWDAQTFVFVK
jgi:hypothetical protein